VLVVVVVVEDVLVGGTEMKGVVVEVVDGSAAEVLDTGGTAVEPPVKPGQTLGPGIV